MGLSPYKKCSVNTTQPAPNPSPDRWMLLDKAEFANGHVLKVRYYDCTNYEGQKVMVYRGPYVERSRLDPHFQPSGAAPVARFRPDAEGWGMACALAKTL